MTRYTLRGLLSHKLRSTLTAIAIVLGTAMMAGTFVITDQIESAFSDIFGNAFSGTDVFVSKRPAFGNGGGGDQAQVGPLDASLINRVQEVPGVAKVSGQIQAAGSLVVNGEFVNAQGGAPTLVISTQPKPFNQDTIVDGHFPVAPGEVAIPQKEADDHNLHVGQHVELTTLEGVQPVTISGIFKFGTGVSSIGGATVVATTFADAQQWYDRVGKTSTISVQAEPGVTPKELKQRIAAAVPADVKVQTGAEAAKEQTDQIAGGINSFFTPALLAFAGAAVLVGAFVIFNTFSITVAQRMREFAMLRTIGAMRRQVLRSVLGEALAVGFLASAIGIAAGVGFAKLLGALFDAVGFGLPLAAVTIHPRTVLVPMAVGVTVTLLASLAPARRATRVPPVAALREGAELPPGRFARFVPYVAGLLFLLGVGGVWEGVTGNGPTSARLLAIAGGAILSFIGLAMVSRYLIRPLSRGVGWPIERLSRMSGRLARENTTRNPARTAVTAAALMIGIGLVVFFTVIINGFKESFLGAIDDSVTSDLIIQSHSQGLPVPTSAASTIAGVPGIEAALPLTFTQVKIGNGGTDVVNGVDPAKLPELYKIQWQKGGSDALLSKLRGNNTVVEEQFAKSHNLNPGSTFQITTVDGLHKTLHVIGQYKDPVLFTGFMVDHAEYSQLATDSNPQILLVRYSPGANADQTTAAVKGALRAFPDVNVQTNAEFKSSISSQVNQLLYLLYVLLAMSVVISLFGIVNTLALSVFERTREIGMLRAIGTTRLQLRETILYESLITAIIGGLLGIVIGLILARVVALGFESQGIIFAVPYGQLILSLVVAAIAGVIAAAFPARRAARLNVLEALQYE
jgi:putative ABC transport system permease protein